ncbi:zinc-binding dehydrogenase [Paracoccus sp. (in: a-proteobacteria)]
MAAGAIIPRIDRSFTLDDIADAHAYLESGQPFGKVVVVTSPSS